MTFPDNENFPAEGFKFAFVLFVSFNSSFKFLPPEFFVGCRPDFAITAIVRMPETAVDKDNFFEKEELNLGGRTENCDLNKKIKNVI